MDAIKVNDLIDLIPYYPDPDTALLWYQDEDLCYMVDGVRVAYTFEKLQRMYDYLCAHGLCFYIRCHGALVGDIALQRSGELCIVISAPYQRLGIGRACVKRLISLAESLGYPSVFVKIFPFNAPSIGLFTSLGFVQGQGDTYELKLT